MEQIIKDNAPKPAGLLPKNIQAFVIVGLALVMVVIMALTGHKRPTASPRPQAVAPLPNPVPVNPQKVTDFQKDIEQAQRESAPQVEAALLEQQKQLAAQGQISARQFPSAPYGILAAPAIAGNAYPPGSYAATLPPGSEAQSGPDPIKDEQRKRAYLSLFSDNLALTYRKELHNEGVPGAANSSMNARTASSPAPTDLLPPQGASLTQANAEQQQSGLLSQLSIPVPVENKGTAAPARDTVSQSQPEPAKSDPAKEHPKSALPALHQGKEYVLFEGTVLEALLINRLDGTFAGPVSCLLSNNVYSHDRQHLLIPAGSKIVGEASKVDTFGQARLAVAFHRLIMPDGYSVSLDQFKGLDQEGATALKDKVNNHYLRIFGASVAVGVLGGVAQAGTGNVLNSTATDRVREGFGISLATAGEHILDRFLNILPTVTIREGTRVKIYLSNDLLLPDYTTHTMPANL